MIAVGLLAVVLVCLAGRFSRLRRGRGESLDLRPYEDNARSDAAFPFDYLTR